MPSEIEEHKQALLSFLEANLKCPYFVVRGVIQSFFEILISPVYDFDFCFECFQKLLADSTNDFRAKPDPKKAGGFFVKLPISPFGSKKQELPPATCLYLYYYKNKKRQVVLYNFIVMT